MSVLHRFILVGIVLISTCNYAQKIEDRESNYLKFQEHLFEALKQKAINNYTKAIESLEKCNEFQPDNLAVNFEFSKNYLLLKKYFEAEIFVNKALEEEPENIFLLLQKVNVYKAQRNFEQAIKLQQKIIKINPKYSNDLVLLYIQNREFKKAEKLVTSISAKGLKSRRTKSYIKYLDSRRKVKEAVVAKKVLNNLGDLESLKKLFEKNSDYKTLKSLLSLELESANFEMLYKDSKQGLDLYPAQPYLYRVNGLALNKLLKYNDAITVLTVGIDFVIDNNELEAEFYEQLAIAYQGLKKDKEALIYKQKALKLRQKE